MRETATLRGIAVCVALMVTSASASAEISRAVVSISRIT